MNTLHCLLMKTHLKLKRQMRAKTMKLGLSSGQPKILEYLSEYGEHDQKSIADYCEIEQATAGSVLNRMEQNGLITRKQHIGNRRSLYASLTPKGEEAAEAVKEIFKQCERELTRSLTPKEEEELVRLLGKVWGGKLS